MRKVLATSSMFFGLMLAAGMPAMAEKPPECALCSDPCEELLVCGPGAWDGTPAIVLPLEGVTVISITFGFGVAVMIRS